MAKFLLVDDSEYMRFEITELLTSLGHDVTSAENGLEGYRVASKIADFDFILTDFNMPVWDGFKMLENIRKIPDYESVPIGMLTTESSKNLKSRGKELGVSVWYIKPLDHDLFTKTINMILDERAS